MKSYVFQVVVEDDALETGGKAYHAYCPALKGCHTWGRTYDEALANVREAVELYVEDLRESGSRIPGQFGPAAGRIARPPNLKLTHCHAEGDDRGCGLDGGRPSEACVASLTSLGPSTGTRHGSLVQLLQFDETAGVAIGRTHLG